MFTGMKWKHPYKSPWQPFATIAANDQYLSVCETEFILNVLLLIFSGYIRPNNTDGDFKIVAQHIF